MKTSLIAIMFTTALCCGCASHRDVWHDNGDLQVSIHVPEGMVGQPVTVYINDYPADIGTNLTYVISLPPYWKNKIKVEMTGTKPFEQNIKVAGYGSKQVLDVNLAKE
jgi:hypothetical protein